MAHPWFELGDVPVYRPWSIFPWWFHFDAYAPIVFDEAGAIAAASGLVGCGTAILGSVWRARQTRNVTTYDLESGPHALVERSRDFTLVPWRDVLERNIGRAGSGIMRADGISWQFGRGRPGLSIS